MTRTFSFRAALVAICLGAAVNGADAQTCCNPCYPSNQYSYPVDPGTGAATGDSVLPPTMQSQPVAPPPTALASLGAGAGVGGGGTGGDSLLGGYIDPAVVQTRFRLRYDHVEGGDSDRAEFLYAAYDLTGVGFTQDPVGQSDALVNNLDYEEISLYFEYAIVDWFSVFAEVPFRFTSIDGVDVGGAALNGVGDDGIGDVVGGFRVALIATDSSYLTFQFKVDTASGDPGFALGNGNTSLIPGLLMQHKVTDEFTVFGEIHGIIPLNGSSIIVNPVPGSTGDQFGSVLRMGLGGSLLLIDQQAQHHHQLYWINEFVAWDFLGGTRSVGTYPNIDVVSANDDFVLNYKTGLRYNINQLHSFYGGWGMALTGDDLYDDIFRFEYALNF